MLEADLLQHYEKSLGALDGAWSETSSGDALLFRILRFSGSPTPAMVTYSTLGLSNSALGQTGGGTVRQELVFSCYDGLADSSVPALLHAVAADLTRRGRAEARGEVLGPGGPLMSGTELTALYAALPVVFPDELGTWSGSDPATFIAWLFPIASDEAQFIRERGWRQFEELLAARDPDLFDLGRGSVVLP